MEADRQLHSGNMKHTSLTRQSADKELKIEVEHLCFASAHCGLDGEASEILFASHCPTATSLLVCIPCPARVRFPAPGQQNMEHNFYFYAPSFPSFSYLHGDPNFLCARSCVESTP